MNTLLGFERLFGLNMMKRNLVTKAIQYGYLKNAVKRNLLQTNAEYKTTWNRIMRNHFTAEQKMNMLRAMEHETNLERLELALRSVDPNLRTTNLYNQIANLHGIRMRAQQGGTCWFHAIINGLLMSPRPRRLLRRMVQHVPSVNFGSDVCPMKNARREWFLKYIKHRLDGPGAVHNTFRNMNVIRSAGLRGLGRPWSARYSFLSVKNALKRGNASGGESADLRWFYEKMFPKGIFIIKKFKGRVNIPHSLGDYELTHAYIRFEIKKPSWAHAITGYKTAQGAFGAFDSSSNTKIPEYDWTRASTTTGYEERFGIKADSVTVHAVYMMPEKNIESL
jgi:hypothetical protein